MITEILLFLLGLAMVALGGDSFVGYGVSLANKLRLPRAVVGATVVAVGTSLPEIVVAVTAAAGGSARIAAGSAMGSVLYNAALAGGLLALIRPASGLGRRDLMKRLCFFLLAALMTALSVQKTGALGVGLGIVLLCLFAVYAVTGAAAAQTVSGEADGGRPELILVGLLVGALALYMGSGFIVDNGILLANRLGMPERLAALTFVSLGTAVPDVAAAVCAALRRQPSLALGNIVGANIIDLMLVIGIPALVAPMEAGPPLFRDMAAACAAMLLLVLPPALTGRLRRWQGAALLLLLAACLILNFI